MSTHVRSSIKRDQLRNSTLIEHGLYDNTITGGKPRNYHEIVLT